MSIVKEELIATWNHKPFKDCEEAKAEIYAVTVLVALLSMLVLHSLC